MRRLGWGGGGQLTSSPEGVSWLDSLTVMLLMAPHSDVGQEH